jgi:excinuclease ABC subunit B
VGRAARNSEGHVIMYADTITESMDKAISETNRRRAIQQKYNEEHGITPTTIQKAVRELISISKEVDKKINDIEKDPESMDSKELKKLIEKVEKRMKKAAADLDFETAIEMRERLAELKLMYNRK